MKSQLEDLVVEQRTVTKSLSLIGVAFEAAAAAAAAASSAPQHARNMPMGVRSICFVTFCGTNVFQRYVSLIEYYVKLKTY